MKWPSFTCHNGSLSLSLSPSPTQLYSSLVNCCCSPHTVYFTLYITTLCIRPVFVTQMWSRWIQQTLYATLNALQLTWHFFWPKIKFTRSRPWEICLHYEYRDALVAIFNNIIKYLYLYIYSSSRRAIKKYAKYFPTNGNNYDFIYQHHKL